MFQKCIRGTRIKQKFVLFLDLIKVWIDLFSQSWVTKVSRAKTASLHTKQGRAEKYSAFLFSCTELKKTIVTAKTIVDAEANHIERVNNICSDEREN